MEQNNKMKTTLIGVVLALIIGGALGYLVGGIMNNALVKKDSMTNLDTGAAGTDEWKIQNAMGAAPDAISKDAAVFDWPGKEGAAMRELRKGTNTWTCIPDWPISPGNDPVCVDEMAMQWFGAYMSQKPPHIAQAGLGYMLQGGSSPSNTDPFATAPKPGESWMTEPSHIVIFPSSKLDTKIYGTDSTSGKPWVMWAGTPYEHIMVPVK